MSEPDWFMNLIYWWVYDFLNGIIVDLVGWFFAIFSDWDWGRITMVGIGEDLPIMKNVQDVVTEGGYGA